MVSAQELTAVIAVLCPAGSAGDDVRITVGLKDRDDAFFPQPMPIVWRVVDEAADGAQVVNADVLVEVAVLVANRLRCPLTAIAARYTEDRRANFDIYLPEWLARHNQRIFGSLYAIGVAYLAAMYLSAGKG